MKYICDAPAGLTWFRLETDLEATEESKLMNHAVEKHFGREEEKSKGRYRPSTPHVIERNIGLKAHLDRDMPMFLTLRDSDGHAKVTVMLPTGGQDDGASRIIVVGRDNSDPYPEYGSAIEALGAHFGITLDRARCFPYHKPSVD